MINPETAIKLKEAGLEWEPKVGDIVSAIWDPNGSTGGLQKCVLQERPIYGLSWENGEWLYCNGIINNTPFVTPLKSNKDFKGVALFPRLDQLLVEIEKRDWEIDLQFFNNGTGWFCEVAKTVQFRHNKPRPKLTINNKDGTTKEVEPISTCPGWGDYGEKRMDKEFTAESPEESAAQALLWILTEGGQP